MTSPFVVSVFRRREIVTALETIAAQRATDAIEPEDATKQAHKLLDAYLIEVLDQPELAELFRLALENDGKQRTAA